MSSTKSPISSGPTYAGAHNSSTVQRSWRCLLYFQMIRARRGCEIEFQCRLAQFVISKRFGTEVSMRWITMEVERQYDEFGGMRGAPPGKEECLISCPRWARGVLMVMEECRMKLRGANPGQGAPMGIEERLCSGAAHWGWASPKDKGGKESGIKLRCS